MDISVNSRGDRLLIVQVPIIPMPPRWEGDGLNFKQQDGMAVTEKLVKVYEDMIGQMNAAIKDLPVLRRPS